MIDPPDDKPPELGPDAISVLEGSTFMVSDAHGDVPEGAVAGLFHEDTRFLHRFVLTVGGRQPQVLSSDTVDYYSAAFYQTNPELPGIPAHSLSIQRFRFVGDGLHERITVRNHLGRPVQVELRLACGADFADLFEVKDRIPRKAGVARRAHDPDHCLLVFEYDHRHFRAASRIHSTEAARIEGDDLVFDLELGPRARWRTTVRVAVHVDEEIMEPVHEEFGESEKQAGRVLRKWQDEVPRFEAGLDLLEHVYRRSIVDLAALRLTADVEGNDYSLPAAGLPWFMAIFGRDTLITSYQSLWVGPDLAKGALHALAALQGKEMNDFKDEEPGKILHEIRFGELTALGLKPHRPYYGTADATPLWLVLLSEYWRFTGDDQTLHALRDNAMLALEWIDRYGDRDGDGYVEYGTRSSQGLGNQGWKDSWDGVQFADGSIPEPPIALCEIQGYVYDAKLRMAELAEKVWTAPELAERLRAEAQALFDRFNRDFWSGERGGYYVLGLDGDKRRVDSTTSNMGHLLWSGIVPDDRADAIVGKLLSEPMFSGWGIRTLSEGDAGYNPIGYHTGTIWPHDNSIIAAGLVRYGFREEANRIGMALFEAAGFTGYRLPEVFAGYLRRHSRFPVRYPTACSPQAWATAAPFLLIRAMLGIDARDGKLTCAPHVPDEVGRLFLHGMHAFGGHFDVEATGTSGEVSVTR
ncbi:MAG: amylo-alpha-1,6-glucosidase [Actinobacteria bacterium]|nr:amylo-alpha-1,6-glucosidase [Actinomycetota bacterium]